MVRDWTKQNRTWFAAVQVEKTMMAIILTLIVAVAVFVVAIGWAHRVAAAGLAGIVGEAGGVIVLDREAVIAEADSLGLFIYGTE